MKKINGILIALFISMIFALPIFADSNKQYVVDKAEFLTQEQKTTLENSLKEISDKQGCDVICVTVKNLEGYEKADFSDKFYVENGYGRNETKDGAMLLLTQEERGYYFYTKGFGAVALTDKGRKYIMDKSVLPYLKKNKYDEAFNSFATQVDVFLTQAKTGKPYDGTNMPKKSLGIIGIIIGAIGGFASSFFVAKGYADDLKSVRRNANANSYTKSGSLNIIDSQDRFLFRNITRTKKSNDKGGGSTMSSGRDGDYSGTGGSY